MPIDCPGHDDDDFDYKNAVLVGTGYGDADGNFVWVPALPEEEAHAEHLRAIRSGECTSVCVPLGEDGSIHPKDRELLDALQKRYPPRRIGGIDDIEI